MPSEHLSAFRSNGGRDPKGAMTDRATKATCPDCQHTVRIEVIAGERIATDTELIRTVPLKGAKLLTWGRRVHAERCQALKAQGERDALHREKKQWLLEQKAARTAARSTRARGRSGR